MNRLQLATLLSWAGDEGVQGRKRLQKVVYFLQQAGCNLGCQFTLHYFGPYSRDVADACDEMVAAGLIDETVREPNGIRLYEYRLRPQTRALLDQTGEPSLSGFRTLGAELIQSDMRPLELGSTILFYYRQSRNWNDSFKEACRFKKLDIDSDSSHRAFELAQRVEKHSQR